MWEYQRKEYNIKFYSELVEALNIEGLKNWEVIYYHEEKQNIFNNEILVKILFKRLKNPVCQQQD